MPGSIIFFMKNEITEYVLKTDKRGISGCLTLFTTHYSSAKSEYFAQSIFLPNILK